MLIQFDLTIEDWVNFQEYYKAKKAPLYKLLMPILGITAAMLICLNVIYWIYTQQASLVTVLSGIFLLLIIYLFIMKKKSVNVLRKAAANLKEQNPNAFGTRQMTFEDEKITIVAGNTETVILWKDIEQWDEAKDYYYIYNTKGFVYIVPKRAIEDEATFVNTLNQGFLVE